MKYLILILSILPIFYLNAQSVGIGAAPNPNAILDLTSINKGLLIPRMTYSQRITITASIGMLVYQTNSNTVPAALAGFYIYDGSIWKRMARADELSGSGSTPGWTISGDDQFSSVTGNVGIGTSTPTSKFHLYGNMNMDAASNPIIQFKNAGVDKGFLQLSSNNIRIGTNSGNSLGKFIIRTDGGDRVFVDSLGNVGIGESNPESKLHVYGSARLTPPGTSTGAAYLQLYTNPYHQYNPSGPTGISFYNWLALGNNNYSYSSKFKIEMDGGAFNQLKLYHVDYEDQLVLSQYGKVGIGKSPSEKLDVKGIVRIYDTMPILKLQSDDVTATTNGIIDFSTSTSSNTSKIGVQFGALKLSGRSNSTNTLFNDLVLENNNVGINNSSPDTKLHILSGQSVGLSNTQNGYIMNGSSGGNNMILGTSSIQARSGTNNSTPLNIQPFGGNTFIGGSVDVFSTLDVGGQTNIYDYTKIHGDGQIFAIDGNNPQMAFFQNGVYKTYLEQNSTGFTVGVNGGNLRLNPAGQVSIGAVNNLASSYRLTVDGKMICEEVKVELFGNWPDYVFHKDYDLIPLPDLEKYIQTTQHLPNIPAADQVQKEGFELGEMNKKLLEKIEELTLYLIAQNKRIDSLEKELKNLAKQ